MMGAWPVAAPEHPAGPGGLVVWPELPPEVSHGNGLAPDEWSGPDGEIPSHAEPAADDWAGHQGGFPADPALDEWTGPDDDSAAQLEPAPDGWSGPAARLRPGAVLGQDGSAGARSRPRYG